MNKAAISLRSTLWIIAAFVLVAAPHAARFPLWLSALVAILCVWRIYVARMRMALPPRWLPLLFAVAGAAALGIEYRTLFGRDAGVALLTLALALKLMETRTQRDGMMLVFIGYFLVITNFFYSQSIPTGLYLLGCVWLLTTAMIGLQHTQESADFRGPLRASAVMLAQSVPLMALFFLLFPRIDGPLWGMPSDAFAGVSGLSDNMSPGSLNKLVLSDDVALRAAFTGDIPPQNRLYWRGPVLSEFDGRTWRAAPRLPRSAEAGINLQGRGAPVRYTVTVEPHNRRWLFALDMPGLLPPRASVTAEYELQSPAPVTRRVRYEMESWLDYGIGQADEPTRLRRMLALPQGFNPRALELGQQLRAQHGNSAAIVAAVLNRMREEKFVYTLEPPLLGTNGVDEFLFETRSGFCEHFASAFVVLMRAAGVPARVVTGYLGGEYNALGNYLIVRQSEAHAWTEVWLDNRGWVRVDPTNQVAPIRGDSGLIAALPEAATLARGARGNALLNQLALTFDSIANTWNQTVLGYNMETQRALLYRAGLDESTWQTLAIMLIVSTAIVTLLLALFTLRQRRGKNDAALDAYQLFCRKIARAGMQRAGAEGPHDYAARIARARPDLGEASRTITALYVSLRYEKTYKIKYLQELRQRVKAFSV